jgi:superoxide dismutase
VESPFPDGRLKQRAAEFKRGFIDDDFRSFLTDRNDVAMAWLSAFGDGWAVLAQARGPDQIFTICSRSFNRS